VAWEYERDEDFDKALRDLKKRYPNAERDILGEFKSGPPVSTDPLPKYERKLWKGRAPCKDAQKGKSKGFRIIYYWDSELPNWCCLGTVYIKADYANLPDKEISTLFLSVKARFDRFAAAHGKKPDQTNSN
jgi:mRNA-degrading endonuclease RelE of RelBE toxin-antitoxin system